MSAAVVDILAQQAGTIVTALLLFAVNVILARVCGAGVFGEYAYVASICSLAAVLMVVLLLLTMKTGIWLRELHAVTAMLDWTSLQTLQNLKDCLAISKHMASHLTALSGLKLY